MQFDSWAEFLHMGGYALYVWLSFGVTLLAMIGLIIQTKMAAKALKQDAHANEKRQTRIRQAMEVKQ